LQETKVHDEAFPLNMVQELGYHVDFYGQKAHYGVALLYKNAPIELHKGFPHDAIDAQKRFIYGKFDDQNGDAIWVLNGYFPQGENRNHPTKFALKQKFYADLLELLQTKFNSQDKIVLMGDLNISPQDCDIGIGEVNRRRWLASGKCSFLPEERSWLAELQNWGLLDSFRLQNPNENNSFSWFDYRSRAFEDNPKRGLRIDLILVSEPLKNRIKNCGIDYAIRGLEKPSDHAPIWLEI